MLVKYTGERCRFDTVVEVNGNKYTFNEANGYEVDVTIYADLYRMMKEDYYKQVMKFSADPDAIKEGCGEAGLVRQDPTYPV